MLNDEQVARLHLEAAKLYAQAVRAQVTALGMTAANMQREACGNSMAYDDRDFLAALEQNGLGPEVNLDHWSSPDAFWPAGLFTTGPSAKTDRDGGGK